MPRVRRSPVAPKTMLSFRISTENYERLKERAEIDGVGMSTVINTAVTALLDYKIYDPNLRLTKEDILYFSTEIEKLGKWIPLWLFLKMIMRERLRQRRAKVAS